MLCIVLSLHNRAHAQKDPQTLPPHLRLLTCKVAQAKQLGHGGRAQRPVPACMGHAPGDDEGHADL